MMQARRHARRHARDYERLIRHSETLITWAAITLMPRRLARKGAAPQLAQEAPPLLLTWGFPDSRAQISERKTVSWRTIHKAMRHPSGTRAEVKGPALR
ncbi:hypothetical protein GCM10010206_79500 [Streptomyces cinerochromogenes]|nr:hypothetical protein GCM10010206_79500 [Streptomyces cinerochromogenes]